VDDIIRLIVIEESANDAEVILNSLRKARYPIRPRHVEDDEDLGNALSEQEWDLIISVPSVGEFTVIQACEMIKNSRQDIPVIALCPRLDGCGMAEMLNAGVQQIIPRGNDACLRIVVGQQLKNLTDRRKRKQLEQLYKETQRHNRILLESSRDSIAYVHDGMHIYANPSYLEMFEYKSMEDLEGMPVMDLVSLDDQPKFRDFMRTFMNDGKEEEQRIDLKGLKSNKKHFNLTMEISQAIYDSERSVQIIIRDKSHEEEAKRREMEAKLEANRRDPLTGLFNRQHFAALLEKAMAKAIEKQIRSIVFYISMDNLGANKEGMGIVTNDEVMKNLGKIFTPAINELGVLARFSDTVFTVLLTDKDNKYGIKFNEYAAKSAQEICKIAENTVTEVGNRSVITTCSIGFAQISASAENSRTVLKDAFDACSIATKRGGNTFEEYKAVLKKDAGQKTDITKIIHMIETAEEKNRLSLRFQAIVSLQGGNNPIYEVFLRMVDDDGKNVPAGEIFAAAEQSGLSIRIDKWVFKKVIEKIIELRKLGRKIDFFIKLSDQAVKDENMLFYLSKLLKDYRITGENLIIEISETIAISHIKIAKVFISRLQTLKCRSAIEHFGTGLNYATTLKHLSVDFVKIDSSFSKGLSTSAENQQSVKDIVNLAHESGKLTIAESIEDANSLMILYQCAVDFAQGYYIHEPDGELSYDFSEEGDG
jgi:diguanylate cyclase (GGDEF)-like protein/PAS domain S-box-containing protein